MDYRALSKGGREGQRKGRGRKEGGKEGERGGEGKREGELIT